MANVNYMQCLLHVKFSLWQRHCAIRREGLNIYYGAKKNSHLKKKVAKKSGGRKFFSLSLQPKSRNYFGTERKKRLFTASTLRHLGQERL